MKVKRKLVYNSSRQQNRFKTSVFILHTKNVVAPGQEKQLWEAVRCRMDEAYGSTPASGLVLKAEEDN
jgi:hypothetical protein